MYIRIALNVYHNITSYKVFKKYVMQKELNYLLLLFYF